MSILKGFSILRFFTALKMTGNVFVIQTVRGIFKLNYFSILMIRP